MSTIRIAVASTPLTATLDEAVPAVIAAVEQAARLGARIVCLPETGLPGHRVQARPVPDVPKGALEDALREVAGAARTAGVVTIVGTERPTSAGREILSVVFGADGTRSGERAKTQIDPTEERDYIPGTGRRVFTAAGVTIGIAICHEAFRYPEITRSLVLAGAQIVFVPHFVTTEDGSLPTGWCAASSPYNEKALLCRALENTVFVAASNVAGPDQGSATCIIAPDGMLVVSLDYGRVGVVAADLDLDQADRLLALRWAPERNAMTVGQSDGGGLSSQRLAAAACPRELRALAGPALAPAAPWSPRCSLHEHSGGLEAVTARGTGRARSCEPRSDLGPRSRPGPQGVARSRSGARAVA